MKTTNRFQWMAALAMGIAITCVTMTSCSKEDNPVDIPGDVPSVGGGNMVDGNWTYKVSGNDVMLTGYTGWMDIEYLLIPSKVGKDSIYVTYISTPWRFSEFKSLKTLAFGEDCKIDEMPAVKGCTTLEQIRFGAVEDKLPNSMKTVKGNTFQGTAIKKIDFNQVSTVGNAVFSQCERLDSVNIPNANVSLGEEAFIDILSKCTVTLNCKVDTLSYRSVMYSPQILVKCNDGAIGWCGDSRRVANTQDFLYWTHKNDTLTIASTQQGIDNFPDKQDIKTNRWLDYTMGTKVLILSDVCAIGSESFDGLKKLEAVTLNDGVTTIGEHAFRHCESLKEITIPASVTKIDQYVFQGCKSMKSVTINGNPEISSFAFNSCDAIETVIINGNPTIANLAFTSSALKTVIINGNPTIADGAFPKGVKIE